VALPLGLNSKALGHLFVEEAFARTVRLDPFSINDKLRDSVLACLFHDFVGSSGSGLDVDIREGSLRRSRKRLASRQSGHQGEE